MSTCLVTEGDFQRHFAHQDDVVSVYARSIDAASEALLDAPPSLRTVNEALRLYHIAKGLRDRLDILCGLALERADELCGANQVIVRISEAEPYGGEVTK